jgi:hypothetical protein
MAKNPKPLRQRWQKVHIFAQHPRRLSPKESAGVIGSFTGFSIFEPTPAKPRRRR